MEEVCKPTGAGLSWRVVISIAVVFGWLVLILLYAAFWSSGFSLFQNIIVTLASLIAGVAILGGIWASYGFRFASAREPGQ